ncbi:MAG: N-acetylglucosamine-6-phosphate deacetylase [Erysipelotrichaceae bacterium]
MKILVKSHRIYTERGCINGAFEVLDDKIIRIYQKENIPKHFDGEVKDFGNHRIIPGIIEMHVHGYKGWSAMSTNVDEINHLARALTTSGVTSFLPTNHYLDTVIENCKAIALAYEGKRYGARNLGVHMEGPFISTKVLGSVDILETHAPDIELFKTFYEASNHHFMTLTLAPEIPGNLELIDYLVAHHINPCIGHSNATYKECEEAIDRGAIITQKTGNCMRGIHQREVGVVGAAMLDQRIYNEINSDLAHCSKEFLEILYKMKGYNKLCIVADNGIMSGMKCGRYELPEKGLYEVDTSGLLHISNGTIDGSALSILDGIKNWVEVIKIPMEEAVVMASLNPAKLCHVEDHKGSIKEFKDCDFVVIDDDYHVIETVVEGTCEYSNNTTYEYDNVIYHDYLKQPF